MGGVINPGGHMGLLSDQNSQDLFIHGATLGIELNR
jgi:hypothetical protein